MRFPNKKVFQREEQEEKKKQNKTAKMIEKRFRRKIDFEGYLLSSFGASTNTQLVGRFIPPEAPGKSNPSHARRGDKKDETKAGKEEKRIKKRRKETARK
jgi:hypothetical protein